MNDPKNTLGWSLPGYFVAFKACQNSRSTLGHKAGKQFWQIKFNLKFDPILKWIRWGMFHPSITQSQQMIKLYLIRLYFFPIP
jgi:hypothetical protein